MALYFIEYDLRKQRSYQPLYDELARFGAISYLESAWALKHSSTSATALRDHFKGFIDADDGLMVAEVTSWACVGCKTTPKQLG